jgi:capsular exopolysaccharide synthesis family protein
MRRKEYEVLYFMSHKRNLDEISLQDLYDLLLRSKYWLLIAIICSCVGSYIQIKRKPSYTSHGTVIIEKSETSPLQAMMENFSGGAPMGGRKRDELEKYVEFFKSHQFLRIVSNYLYKEADMEIYRDLGIGRPGIMENIKTSFGLQKKVKNVMVVTPDLLLNRVSNNVNIVPVNSNTLKISFKSDSIKTSTSIANILLKLGVEIITAKNLKELDEAQDFLNRQIGTINKKISALQESIIDLRKAHGSLSSSGEKNLAASSQKLKENLVAARTELYQRQLLLKKVKAENSSKGPMDYGTISMIKNLTKEVTYWNTRIKSLSGILKDFDRSQKKLPNLEQSIENLTRQVEFEYRFTEQLKNQLLQIQVQRISLKNKVRLGEKASPVTTFKFSSLLRRFLIASIASIVLTLIIFYVYEVLVHVVHNEREMEKFAAAFLGVLPKVSTPWSKILGRNINGTGLNAISTDHDFENAMKVIRSKLQYGFESEEKFPAVVCVTSPTVGTGTSSVAYGLARSFARVDRKVLLIDSNLLNSAITDELSSPEHLGLTDVYWENCSLQEGVDELVPNLHIMPIGWSTAETYDLLMAKKLPEVIEQFKQSYDVIVFDAPPIFSMHDSVALAHLSDYTVLVAREAYTRFNRLHRSIEELNQCQVKNVGCVLNFSHSESSREIVSYYKRSKVG